MSRAVVKLLNNANYLKYVKSSNRCIIVYLKYLILLFLEVFLSFTRYFRNYYYFLIYFIHKNNTLYCFTLNSEEKYLLKNTKIVKEICVYF